MIVTRSPCQECKERLVVLRASVAELGAERDELRAEVTKLQLAAKVYAGVVAGLNDELAAVEGGLRDAIARLNAFLSAFEGDPEPSENDTKGLVVRLIGLLDG